MSDDSILDVRAEESISREDVEAVRAAQPPAQAGGQAQDHVRDAAVSAPLLTGPAGSGKAQALADTAATAGGRAMSDPEGTQAARLEAVAREMTAGHLPEGITLHAPDGTVTEGPALIPGLYPETPEPEAGL